MNYRLSLCLIVLFSLLRPLAKAQSLSPVTFSYNGTAGTDGSAQTYTVPTGVYNLSIVAFGAAGGSSDPNNFNPGGQGGQVDALLKVTPGQSLTIYVGGSPSGAAKGYNGGGKGGAGPNASYYSGGGGGATDIRLNGTGLSNRVIVAGGGGGHAYTRTFTSGGSGGGLTGGAGGTSIGGQGGTQTAGGAGGAGSLNPGLPGSLGSGGDGFAINASGYIYLTGAGGGGYYGGGSGGNQADDNGNGGLTGSGGGGSSYTDPAYVTSVTHTQGVRSGSGQLTITPLSNLTLSAAATPNSVCAGSTVALSVTAAGGVAPYSYTWAAPASISLSATNTSAVSASLGAGLSGPQTFTITVASPGGAPTSTSVVTLSVLPLPTAYSVTGGGAYCQGSSGLPLGLATSQTGVNYQLQLNGNAVGSSVAGTGNALSFGNQTIAGTYTVRATNATTSCQQTMTGSASITVNPLPTAFTITGGGGYCTGSAGSVVGLSGSQVGVSYQLLRAGMATGTAVSGTGSAISFGPQSATGPYTVLATNTNTSCSQTMNGAATVSSNPLPTPTLVTSGTLTCALTSVTLTAGGGSMGAPFTYAFSAGASQFGGSGANTATVVASGPYSVTVTTANGCSATTTTTVSSNTTAPAVSISPSATAICAGQTVTLAATPGLMTYQWSNGQATASISVSATGAYSVTATTSNGCSATAVASVTVNSLPAVSITPSTTAICAGQVVTLSATPGLNSYQWNTSQTSPTISVSAAGPYSVTVTDANGCANTAMASVTVNPLSTSYSVIGGGAYCAGDAGPSVGLAGSQTGVSYQLLRGGTATGTVVAGTGNSITFGPQSIAGTYTVLATNTSTFCTQNMGGSVVVSTNAVPTVSISPSATAVCAGQSATFSATPGLASYRWIGPGGGMALTTASISASVAGTYSLSVTNASGCTATAQASLSVNPLPTVSIAPPATTLCAGQSTTLTASGADIYQWNTPQTTASLSVSVAGPYSVTGTSTSTGCSNTATARVNVTPLPNATFSGLPTSVCVDAGVVTLTPTIPGGVFSGTGISGNQFSPASAGAGGPYSITYTVSSLGCPNSSVQPITVNPLPMAPMIATQSGHSYPGGVSSLTISQNVGNVILMTSGCIGGTITWAGGSSNTLAVSTFNAGVQTFTATCTSNATGCTSPKSTATVTVVGTTLTVLHRDGNGQINTNTLAPYLQLQNDGNTAIPYSEITVRYWLTVENYSPLLFSINYAQLGSDKVHLKYVPAATGNPTATGYIEFSFDASAGSLAAMSNSGPIQDLINKQDYSYFDQSNDYSYAAVGQFTPNNHITAYRNGVLFYGLEPGPVVPMQSVKAMLQNNTGDGANSIEAVLSVTNDGNVPINYGDLKVRYYFTADNNQPLVLNQVGYTALGAGNVSAQIVTISPALASADRYLELSFSPSLGQLAPGGSTGGVTYQIRHADYSGFTQTNDYSYQGTGGTVVNSHVVVFVAGQRVFGTEPGTGARLSAENEETPLRVQVLGNPVRGSILSVSVSGAEGQALRYELTDVSGHVVGERQVESAGVVDQQLLSIGHQPAGLLLLRVSTPTQSQTVKVLQQ